MRVRILFCLFLFALRVEAAVQSSSTGTFQIPTAPAAGVSVTSGTAPGFSSSYVQLTASTGAAIFITGIMVEEAAVVASTYIDVELATGAGGAEVVVGIFQVAPSTGSTTALTYRPIWPPIAVATSTRIAAKTADSVGAKAFIITLECINQANVVDAKINESSNLIQVAGSAVSTTSAQIGVNAVNWAGGAIPSPNVTGVPKVDVTDFLGSASTGAAGYAGIDWGHVNAPTTTVGLSGTTVGTVTTTTTATTCTTCTTATNLTNLPSIPANWLTATGIAASALNGKGDWMVSYAQPTGFLAATFPSGTIANTTNITAGTITTTTNLTNLPSIPANWLTSTGINAGALNGKGDWLLASSYTTPPTAAAITTNIFQDLTSGSDFSTASSIGKLFVTELDANIGSRMATYTQPSGFLSATFPSFLASTTNITGGIITTVTNLTNSPTAGDFTSTMKTSLNAATPASVTGAVGSVTGSVGSVVGAVGSVTSAITLPSIPSSWITAAGIAATALNGKGDWNIGKTGYSIYGTKTTLDALNDIAAGDVWDVTLASHLTAGSTGFALNGAGAAGDPWTTALPGIYGAGTAGYIVGHNIDAVVSSRLPTSSYTSPPSTSSIANEVWSLDISAITGAGLAGTLLNSAGSAMDPWSTLLPGSYASGTAGYLLSHPPNPGHIYP